MNLAPSRLEVTDGAHSDAHVLATRAVQLPLFNFANFKNCS